MKLGVLDEHSAATKAAGIACNPADENVGNVALAGFEIRGGEVHTARGGTTGGEARSDGEVLKGDLPIALRDAGHIDVVVILSVAHLDPAHLEGCGLDLRGALDVDVAPIGIHGAASDGELARIPEVAIQSNVVLHATMIGPLDVGELYHAIPFVSAGQVHVGKGPARHAHLNFVVVVIDLEGEVAEVGVGDHQPHFVGCWCKDDIAIGAVEVLHDIVVDVAINEVLSVKCSEIAAVVKVDVHTSPRGGWGKYKQEGEG